MKLYDPYYAFGRKQDVKFKRPLFDLTTPLKDVPAGWLMHIEPHIMRHSKFKNCWMWTKTGNRDNITGDPRLSITEDGVQTLQPVKRFIAHLFVNTKTLKPNDYEVVQLCQNKDCMNPDHFQVRTDSGMQRKGIMLKERNKFLSPSEYYQP